MKDTEHIFFSEISSLVHIENHLRYYNCPVIYFLVSFFRDNLDNFLMQFPGTLLLLNP